MSALTRRDSLIASANFIRVEVAKALDLVSGMDPMPGTVDPRELYPVLADIAAYAGRVAGVADELPDPPPPVPLDRRITKTGDRVRKPRRKAGRA